METWEIVLSSAVISTIVSCIATLIINSVSQKKMFKNDYYKKVLNKRMNAYQYIDNQLKTMKITTLDEDAKPYHSMFYGDQDYIAANQNDMMLARVSGLWLSSNMENALSGLNKVLYEINSNITDDINNNVVVAKNYYSQLADARDIVENQMRKDMLELYDVKGFLKEKKKHKGVDYQVKKHVS